MGQIIVEKNVGDIEGLCVITPAVHGDSRSYFMETYSQRDLEENGINIDFVQDNQFMSVKDVLRGLHFQKNFPKTKLVRVIKGSVFDVAVDLRSGSDTYGKWYGIEWPKVEGAYQGTASAKGYSADGVALNISDKDQKWLGLKDTFKFLSYK